MGSFRGDVSDAVEVREVGRSSRGHRIIRYGWLCPTCGKVFWTRLSNKTETCSFVCSAKLKLARRTTKTRQQLREEARAFVRAVNATTICIHCGAQPIEWHNSEHVRGRQRYWIHRMVSRGESIEEIKAEMDRCMALCRRCHMKEDGRLKELIAMAEVKRVTKPPRICTDCGDLKKHYGHGLCQSCYQKRYMAINGHKYRPGKKSDAHFQTLVDELGI